MLTAFCGCLNVKIHIKGNRINEFPYPGNKLEFAESRDDFFLQVRPLTGLPLFSLSVCL